MCARFTLYADGEFIAFAFGLSEKPHLEPAYNIAPSSNIAAVVQQNNLRILRSFKWGLVPHWASDPKNGYKMINARAETLAEKPSFRSAFRKRRCLIPVDGFYEWLEEKGKKQPYRIAMRDGAPFGFAALWERWEGGGEPLETCTIITTSANEVVAPIHDRMPAIILPDSYGTWLDTKLEDPPQLTSLLAPYPHEPMIAYRVDRRMGNPQFNSPDCVSPLNQK